MGKRMVKWRNGLLGLLAGILAGHSEQPSEACGMIYEPVLAAERVPQVVPFIQGNLGLLRASYRPEYLALAYRTLTEPLTQAERASALDVFAPSHTHELLAQPWLEARRELTSVAPHDLPSDVWDGGSYYVNCLPNAFETAAVALRARAGLWGKTSPKFQAWLATQDAVFANCSGGPQPLPPLSIVDPTLQRDYAYQAASALFYQRAFGAARAGFLQIAADVASPWRNLARYLVGRTLVREGLLADPENLTLLHEAQRVFMSIAGDPQLSEWHASAKDYLRLVRIRTDASRLHAELGVSLARSSIEPNFGQRVYDYAWLEQRRDMGAFTADPKDPLSLWMYTLRRQTPEAHRAAAAMYAQTQHVAWLVATLISASDDATGLDAALEAARVVPFDHAAYFTLRYHRTRLLLGKRAPEVLHAELTEALSHCTPHDGLSTVNELKALAIQTAPTLDALLASATILPAGHTDSGAPLLGPEGISPSTADPSMTGESAVLYPAAADVLNRGLTVGQLVAAAGAVHLPRSVRAELAAVAWTRAALLDSAHWMEQAELRVAETEPKFAAELSAVRRQTRAARRKLELVHVLTQHPWLSMFASAWGQLSKDAAFSSAYASYWWCGGPVAAAPATCLQKSEHHALSTELKALSAIGSGLEFLAASALQVQKQFPGDPRMPEILHRIVRGSRYACSSNAQTRTRSSQAVFKRLHGSYKHTPWAKATPYYY